MEVLATIKNITTSPSKVRLVAGLIRKMPVEKALNQLPFVKKGSKDEILNLLKSAVSNAENNFGLEKDNLYVKAVLVNEAPTLHRWRARAFGRAGAIRKRRSHVSIILDEIVPKGPKMKEENNLEVPQIVAAPEGEVLKEKVSTDNVPVKGAGENHESAMNKAFDGGNLGKHDADDKPRSEAKSATGFAKKVFRRKSGQ